MSRYSHNVFVEKYGMCEVAYGYDRMLNEYFISLFKCNVPDDEDDCVFSVGNEYNTLKPIPGTHKLHYSNVELSYLFEEYDVPEEHIMALVNGKPF